MFNIAKLSNLIKILSLVFSISINTSISQTITKIEMKNGFRNYKLNSAFELYSKNLMFSETITQGRVKCFVPNETIIISGYTTSTTICFYKNKLSIIDIFFENISEENFEAIYQYLRPSYGSSIQFTFLDAPKYYNMTIQDRGYSWDSKTVLAQLIYINSKRQGRLMITSKIIAKRISDDDL